MTQKPRLQCSSFCWWYPKTFHALLFEFSRNVRMRRTCFSSAGCCSWKSGSTSASTSSIIHSQVCTNIRRSQSTTWAQKTHCVQCPHPNVPPKKSNEAHPFPRHSFHASWNFSKSRRPCLGVPSMDSSPEEVTTGCVLWPPKRSNRVVANIPSLCNSIQGDILNFSKTLNQPQTSQHFQTRCVTSSPDLSFLSNVEKASRTLRVVASARLNSNSKCRRTKRCHSSMQWLLPASNRGRTCAIIRRSAWLHVHINVDLHLSWI